MDQCRTIPPHMLLVYKTSQFYIIIDHGSKLETSPFSASHMVLIYRNAFAGSLLVRRLQLSFFQLKYCPRLGKSHILQETQRVLVWMNMKALHMLHCIFNGSEYGEGNIQTDNKVFSACLKGNSDQPALVHQGALNLFLYIMQNTDFQAKVNWFI